MYVHIFGGEAVVMNIYSKVQLAIIEFKNLQNINKTLKIYLVNRKCFHLLMRIHVSDHSAVINSYQFFQTKQIPPYIGLHDLHVLQPRLGTITLGHRLFQIHFLKKIFI